MAKTRSADLTAWSLEDLEAEQIRLSNERAALRERQLAVARALDVVSAREAAKAKLATLSDPEKAALLQALEAQGVVAESAAGTPGGGT